jgi:Uma2 family endonuclease
MAVCYHWGMATAAVENRPGLDIPPLVNGDNLSREEFERLWEMHPEIKRAELIDGIVYLEMAVGPEHATKHSSVIGWLVVYAAGQAGVEVCDNATLQLADHDVQPDAMLRRTGATAMSVRLETAISGPPEFVFEVAASSAGYDLHQKLRVYERNGVPEYVVWQLYENRIEWFELREGRYERRTPGADGIIESRQFPGLRLHVKKMLDGDLAGVLAPLTAG